MNEADAICLAVHRLTVAAYTLQHPDSVKPYSVAVHLTSLCLAIERGVPAHLIRTPMQRAVTWLRRHPPGRLEPPALRGPMSVTDIAGAASADEHCRRVKDWAAAVWAAWHPQHHRVRSWLDGIA